MSEEMIERFKNAFAAYERGEIDPILDQLNDDFVVNDGTLIEDTTVWRGPEGMRKNLDRIAEAFPEVTYAPVEFVDLEDRMLVRVAVTVHAARTGIEMDAEVGQVWTIREQKASRLDIYPSWDEARRAVGLEG
jgi:ketosteroid isomerase-like protein